MPLTPQEQAELDQLEATHGAGAAPSRLTAEEEAELAELEAGEAKGQQVYDRPIGPNPEVSLSQTAKDLTSPAVWKDIVMGDRAPSLDVEGAHGYKPQIDTTNHMPYMDAVPGAGLLTPVAKGMNALNKGVTGRVAVNTAQGALQAGASGPLNRSADDRMEAAKRGGLTGFLLGAGGEAIGGLLSGTKSVARNIARLEPSEAQAFVKDPSGVQKMADQLDSQTVEALKAKGQDALNAVNTSRANLAGAGRVTNKQLKELLTGKSTSINPREWEGISPTLDQALMNQRNVYGQLPQEAQAPLNALNEAKRSLQHQAKYKPSHAFDPTGEARAAEMGTRANKLKQMIEQAEPGAKALNDSMQQNVLLGKDLKTMARNPLAATKTGSEDKLLRMALADQASGTVENGLYDYTTKRGAAAAINQTDKGSGITGAPLRAAAKYGVRAAYAADPIEKAAKSQDARTAILEALHAAGLVK